MERRVEKIYNEGCCDLYPSLNINAQSDGIKFRAVGGSYSTQRGRR